MAFRLSSKTTAHVVVSLISDPSERLNFLICHHVHSSSSQRVLAISLRRRSGSNAAADSAQLALRCDNDLIVDTQVLPRFPLFL